MTSRYRIAGRIVAWTAVVTLGLGASAGLALAATSIAPSSTADTKAPAKNQDKTSNKASNQAGDRAKHRQAIATAARRTLHGEFVVRGKGGKYVTADTQRGSVTAVSPTAITVRSADGFAATYAVNGDTRVRKNGAKATIAQVKVGDPALVVATKTSAGKTARGVLIAAPGSKKSGKQD
jgi:hypothetical protein